MKALSIPTVGFLGLLMKVRSMLQRGSNLSLVSGGRRNGGPTSKKTKVVMRGTKNRLLHHAQTGEFCLKGRSQENEFHICVRLCGGEGRGKGLSGQFFFVCEKDDRDESSTKSLGGMTRPKDEMGSQIVSSESDIHPILVYISRNNNCQAQAQRFPALTAPEPEFSVIFGSK